MTTLFKAHSLIVYLMHSEDVFEKITLMLFKQYFTEFYYISGPEYRVNTIHIKYVGK